MEWPGKSCIAVSLSCPSSLRMRRALLDTPSDLRAGCSGNRPGCVSCPAALLPELDGGVGEEDPSSRAEVFKPWKSALRASVGLG